MHITHITFVRAEGLSLSAEYRQAATAAAAAEAARLAA